MSVRHLLGAFALLLVPQIASAHAADQSYIYLRVYDGRIEVLHYPSLLRARAAESVPEPLPGRRAVA